MIVRGLDSNYYSIGSPVIVEVDFTDYNDNTDGGFYVTVKIAGETLYDKVFFYTSPTTDNGTFNISNMIKKHFIDEYNFSILPYEVDISPIQVDAEITINQNFTGGDLFQKVVTFVNRASGVNDVYYNINESVTTLKDEIAPFYPTEKIPVFNKYPTSFTKLHGTTDEVYVIPTPPVVETFNLVTTNNDNLITTNNENLIY